MRDIKLFYPYIDDNIKKRVVDTLGTRWLGQGSQTDEFEKKFGGKFRVKYPVMVNSCTSALELAYDLLEIDSSSIVYVPVLTCTATNIPLLRRKAHLRFMDIDPDTLNPVLPPLVPWGIKVVSVDLNGIKSELKADVYDSAQAPGTRHKDGITCYSFQAIKQFTTGDGGLLAPTNKSDYRKAKLLRWFGIDREAKAKANFQYYQGRKMMGDMKLAGYKYQPTDIAASMGLGGLEAYDEIMKHRKALFNEYKNQFKDIGGIRIIDGPDNKYYTLGVIVQKRHDFATLLRENGIESNQVQLRNDIYTLFGGKRQDLPVMNYLEDKYLFLPLNHKVTLEDVQYIGEVVRRGW